MNEVSKKEFTHLKVHTQYSICEGAIKIDDLKDYYKSNKIKNKEALANPEVLELFKNLRELNFTDPVRAI